MDGIYSTVTRERGEADLATGKWGVPLASGHSWQRTGGWGCCLLPKDGEK